MSIFQVILLIFSICCFLIVMFMALDFCNGDGPRDTEDGEL